MFISKQFLFLLFTTLSVTNAVQNLMITSRSSPPTLMNYSNKSFMKQIANTNASRAEFETDRSSSKPSEDLENVDAIAEEIKNEVFVNNLLETPNQPAIVVVVPELRHGPEYNLDWTFIDKDTIRVTFNLYSLPKSLIDNKKHSPETNDQKLNILATMVSMPSRSVKSIFALNYFLFIIRPYKSNKEIIMKMDKLHSKEAIAANYTFFSNSLRLTALNHKEKYTICICYYQTNISTRTPDLIICQDIINDYLQFSHLRADPKHGLLFIATQYSIIIALLAFLQVTLTVRKRRLAQIIGHHLSTKAHHIRTTLSSVSLVRQSFSSLDAAAEQQQQQQQHHAINGHAIQHEPTIDEEEDKIKKRIISSPTIVISEPATPIHHGATSSDENEPFLRRIPSKNHVHFLLGPGEGSDDDNDDERKDIPLDQAANREPYGDQSDALLYMAHILDTNKPWSRHSQDSSLV